MLTLMTFPAAFGEFSASPFCVKAAYLLQLSGQKWQRLDLLDPRKMPHQKLPVLRTPERLVPDSNLIRTWLEAQGADFDKGLSDIQKAQSHTLIRMAEEHLYFQVLLDRWGNDEVWVILRDTYFTEIPALIRKPISGSVRKSVLSGLRTQGIARLTAAQRLDKVEQDLLAITAILWQSPFLLGDQPTSADLSVASMLGAMRSTPVDTPLVLRIKQDTVLTSYLDRVQEAIPLP